MLSPRQVEIVTMVGRDGKTWEEVRAELGISKSTVRMHVTRIRSKCNVAHRPPREGLTEVYYRVVREGVGL